MILSAFSISVSNTTARGILLILMPLSVAQLAVVPFKIGEVLRICP